MKKRTPAVKLAKGEDVMGFPLFFVKAKIDGHWKNFELPKCVEWVNSVFVYDEKVGAEDYDYHLARRTALCAADMDGEYKIIRDAANRNFYGYCEGKATYMYEMKEKGRLDWDVGITWETLVEFSIVNGVVNVK